METERSRERDDDAGEGLPPESGGGATGGEGEAAKLVADEDTNAAPPRPDDGRR